ncbi:Hypothetical predicted protein [Lecanosticta acicola]|uniref:Uncharacterized protein n=1 Tax=Lecanosticta acicola TaxID=111012 RepID=A0AAI8YX94_9PEZI|nr:Hypothetical predicted protein [Lecanosticta acicola]
MDAIIQDLQAQVDQGGSRLAQANTHNAELRREKTLLQLEIARLQAAKNAPIEIKEEPSLLLEQLQTEKLQLRQELAECQQLAQSEAHEIELLQEKIQSMAQASIDEAMYSQLQRDLAAAKKQLGEEEAYAQAQVSLRKTASEREQNALKRTHELARELAAAGKENEKAQKRVERAQRATKKAEADVCRVAWDRDDLKRQLAEEKEKRGREEDDDNDNDGDGDERAFRRPALVPRPSN